MPKQRNFKDDSIDMNFTNVNSPYFLRKSSMFNVLYQNTNLNYIPFNTSVRFEAVFDNFTKLSKPGRSPYFGSIQKFLSYNNTADFSKASWTYDVVNVLTRDSKFDMFEVKGDVNWNDLGYIINSTPVYALARLIHQWGFIDDVSQIGSLTQPQDNVSTYLFSEYNNIFTALSNNKGTHFSIFDLTIAGRTGQPRLVNGNLYTGVLPVLYFKYINDVIFNKILQTRWVVINTLNMVQNLSSFNINYGNLLQTVNGPLRDASAFLAKLASLGTQYIWNMPIDIEYHKQFSSKFTSFSKASDGRDTAFQEVLTDISLIPYDINTINGEPYILASNITNIISQCNDMQTSILSLLFNKNNRYNDDGMAFRSQFIKRVEQLNDDLNNLMYSMSPFTELVTYIASNKGTVYSNVLNSMEILPEKKMEYVHKWLPKSYNGLIKDLSVISTRNYSQGATNNFTYDGLLNIDLLNSLSNSDEQSLFINDVGIRQAGYLPLDQILFFVPSRSGHIKLQYDSPSNKWRMTAHKYTKRDVSKNNWFDNYTVQGRSYLNWFLDYTEHFVTVVSSQHIPMWDNSIVANISSVNINRKSEHILKLIKEYVIDKKPSSKVSEPIIEGQATAKQNGQNPKTVNKGWPKQRNDRKANNNRKDGAKHTKQGVNNSVDPTQTQVDEVVNKLTEGK